MVSVTIMLQSLFYHYKTESKLRGTKGFVTTLVEKGDFFFYNLVLLSKKSKNFEIHRVHLSKLAREIHAGEFRGPSEFATTRLSTKLIELC